MSLKVQFRFLNVLKVQFYFGVAVVKVQFHFQNS
jgi:hypothetical protein